MNRQTPAATGAHSAEELERVRAEAAAEERAAIQEIVERSMRQLSHGHGANAAWILQHIADEIERRNGPSPS